MNEFELIERLFRPLATDREAALDLGDDVALLRPEPGRELVLSKDALVAGVHFFEEDPPQQVAAKLLRVNLSDLAAKGADPLAYLLVLARPSTLADDWLAAFARGLEEDQERFGLGLIGGDTVATPGPLTLSLTILGSVPEGGAILRRGARPGDRLWVSGTLGDAAIGLRIRRGLAVPEDQALPFLARYLLPEPRIELGRRLRGIAHAAIDISDGLVADLGHLCRQSAVGAQVHAHRIPISQRAKTIPGSLRSALTGGDDYELLFAAPEVETERIRRLSEELSLPLACIGETVEGEGVRVLDEKGRELAIEEPGWRHF